MGLFDAANTYTELRPLNIYDVAANEIWLEDMSRQGYHLKDFGNFNGVFQRGEPAERRWKKRILSDCVGNCTAKMCSICSYWVACWHSPLERD